MLEESDAYVEELDEDLEFYKIRTNKPEMPSFLKNTEEKLEHGKEHVEEPIAHGKEIPSSNPDPHQKH